jgi:Zn-dependent protease
MDLSYNIVIFVIVMVISIPLHEFGHALAADWCGDDVPAMQGRVTVEPWAHWDPLGTLLIAVAIFGNMSVLGWGKPVITDPTHYRNGRRGWMLVSVAGILVNLALALIGTAVYRGFHLGAPGADPFYQMVGAMFVSINVGLACFNLIPIPPLDGSKIVMGLLPMDAAFKFENAFRGQGMILLFIVVFVGSQVLNVPVLAFTKLLLGP